MLTTLINSKKLEDARKLNHYLDHVERKQRNWFEARSQRMESQCVKLKILQNFSTS